MNTDEMTSRRPEPCVVLSEALKNTAERLNVSQTALAKIIGLSPAEVSQMYDCRYQLEKHSTQWDLALLFVRIFRSLASIVGNQESARKWINGDNLGLNERPIDLIQQTEGLVRVAQYLSTSTK